MNLFLITLAIFLAVIFLMALGVIFSNKRIQGSCGGEEGCKLCFFKVVGKCRKNKKEEEASP
tara:strand:- start:470 stop:655 length:186 start_codon:yes stop_codon:yes gene_type:complete